MSYILYSIQKNQRKGVQNVPVLHSPRTSTSIGTIRFSIGHSRPPVKTGCLSCSEELLVAIDIFETEEITGCLSIQGNSAPVNLTIVSLLTCSYAGGSSKVASETSDAV